MSRPSAVPPDTEMADILAARGEPGLDALIRMPPGPARQAAITRIVASLAVPLAALHEAGQVHGGICPAAVVHGPSGELLLATPPVAPTPDAEDAPRQPGYAAFEQYTDDPAYPCGPWTDVHGLAALAYFLATGSAPPSALARRVRDDYVPLGDWGGDVYGKAFCDAVDSGLAMPMHARPATVTSFAAAMGALQAAESMATFMPTPEFEPEPEFEPTPTPTSTDEPAFIPLAASPTDGRPADDDALARSTAGVSTQAPPEIPVRRRRMLPLMLVVFALLLAGGGYAWVRMTTPPVQLAGTPQTSSPAPARAPEGPPSAPPAGPEASPQALPQAAPQTAPQTTPPVAAAPAPATVPPVAEPIAEASSSPEPAPETPSEASPPGAGPAAAAGTSDMPPPPVAEPPAPPKAAPVVVRVAVRPWGEVLINGRSRGVSPPLREISLAPGRYQVTVRNASAGDHSMTLTVAPNRPAIITHEFK